MFARQMPPCGSLGGPTRQPWVRVLGRFSSGNRLSGLSFVNNIHISMGVPRTFLGSIEYRL
jgi:hypothetical protein